MQRLQEQDVTTSQPPDPMGLFPPAAFIVGAPKCGTTALASYLAEHPQVAFSRPKEPHRYALDLPGLRVCDDDEAYRSLFVETPRTRLLMEGSVWHLYSAEAVPAILRARPDARFVVLLRNPVTMLASLHRQLLNALDEDRRDFREAWRLSPDRAAGQAIPAGCRAPQTLDYRRTAAFGAMLVRLLERVPRDRVLVMFQEEMTRDTAAAYRASLAFLGLDDDARTDFARVNEARSYRSKLLRRFEARGGGLRESVSGPLKRALGVQSFGVLRRLKALNTVRTPRLEMPPDLAAEIADYYAEDMALLADTLGRDLGPLGWPVGRGARSG